MKRFLPQPAGVLITLAFIILFTVLVLPERTLGSNLGVVNLHGAWVWAGLITFSLAAVSGLAGLISGREKWHAWSRVLGWSGLVFWLTYLPMSVVVQQMNWDGIFWDEPRFRIPLAFGIVAVLLQGGLWLVNRQVLTSSATWSLGRRWCGSCRGRRMCCTRIRRCSNLILEVSSSSLQSWSC